MSTFRASKARAAAVALGDRRARLRAEQIRNEAVQLAPVLKVPRRIDGALYTGGRLRQSINVRKITGGYRVASNVRYALFVEFGTRFMRAQPFMRPALEKVKASG